MIHTELYKRILTSIILLPILIFCVFYNKLFFFIFLILVGTISVFEWYLIHKKQLSIFFYSGFFII